MEQLWQSELRLDGIDQFATTQSLTRLCMLAVQVATLYHEILDDPMEQQRVIHLHFHELHEIVTMKGRLVIEFYTDIAFCRFQQYFGTLLG
jgi:hypothetical protein